MYKKGDFIAFVIITLAVLFANDAFAKNIYRIDPTHSTIGFAVSHVQVGIVRGEFTDYSGEIEFEKDAPDAFRGEIVIQAKSINTRLEARDKHLRSADFFNVENYPAITFKAKKLLKKGDDYRIIGDLTIRGITKELSGRASILGPVKSPFGQEVIGIHGETVINRRDFGVSWNNKMPDGGFVVGDDVKITLDIEADKK